MKSKINPKLNAGDEIILIHMEGEVGVLPGTKGVVTKVTRDPFESEDESIISVKWENGSNLNLISSTDVWKKIETNKVNEQVNGDGSWNYMTSNPDIFEHFDWRWLEKFLYKLRDTGIVNMFGAAPLLYSGKNHIERYYGEGKEDDEEFQEFLEEADIAKNKIIQGVLSYMKKNKKSWDDIELVNRYAKHFSQKILGLYIALSGIRT